jgi:hypothetical protein
MDDFIKLLQQRIEQARSLYDKVRSARIAMADKEEALRSDIRTWERALEAENRRTGKVVAEKPETPHLAGESSNGNGRPNSATEAVLAYIQAAGDRGMSRKEIAAKLLSDDFHVHRNYPYVVISKLKEKGFVEEQNERLVAARQRRLEN